ncbi:cyclase family protein [Iamia majanohamensis]|uniref:Cyclase family protein n=1 Tax=Iamia majanohamensis TaxID=467976 RepID=A0AAF0BUV0_9ACTN|nr:cyclase family protein [Iamia majanohamensis]WCO66115.1 cyclase family protein [Iamia majanohamensis]
MASTEVHEEATTAELDALFDVLCVWGRWGDDDERGALNHQTAAHRAHAAGLVVDGTTVSLARDLPVAPSVEAPVAAQHHMLTSGDALDAQGLPGYEACGDYIGTEVHGLGTTHVDALSHMFVRGLMYGGRPASEVRSDGARRNTVMSLADGVVGRGVLLDVPAAHGVAFLEPDVAIGVADLEAAEEAEGLRVGPGDLLVVSTGRDARRAAQGGRLDPFTEGLAGLAPECLPWLAERQVALLGGDGISDRMPFRPTPQWPFPVHQIGIVAMGLHLVDNMALDRLAQACAGAGRHEFLLTISALRIPGGTGCPVNPVALL